MSKFDAFEMRPMRRWIDTDSTEVFEAMDESEIGAPDENENPIEPYCWTVFGHLHGGGCDSIADCPTRGMAELVYSALSGKKDCWCG